jgi:hypothetical protein
MSRCGPKGNRGGCEYTSAWRNSRMVGLKALPLPFMEVELDLLGAHSFDLKSENAEGIKKGVTIYGSR